MKEFLKITNPADVLDSQHLLQLNKIFLYTKMITTNQMYGHARPAIHAETDGSLKSSVSTPITSCELKNGGHVTITHQMLASII